MSVGDAIAQWGTATQAQKDRYQSRHPQAYAGVSALMGGGSAAPMEMGGASMPSMGQSAKSVYKAMLKYGPKLSKMEWESMLKYLPKQSQLALDLNAQYMPQQYAQEIGQLGEYGPQFQSIMEALQRQGREADLSDVEGMAGRLGGIRATAEGPELAEMRGLLTSQLLDELRAGSELTADDERSVSEHMRSSEIARGLGMGQGSSNRESVAKALAGRSVKAERQSRASSWMSQDSAQRYDPFQAILGRPGTSMAMAQGAMSSGLPLPTGAGTTPNPLSAGFSLGNLAQGQQQMGMQNSQFNQQMGMQQQQYNLGNQLAMANLMATAPKMGAYLQGFN